MRIKLFRNKKDTLEDQSLVIVSYPKSGRTWLRVMLDDLGLTPLFSHAGVTFHHYEFDHTSVLHDLDNFKDKKIVFLSRDPRDTVVSYYYQLSSRMNEFEGSVSDFIKDDKHGIRSVCAFNTGWLKNAHGFQGFYHMRYEDFVDDAEGRLHNFFKFIGKNKSGASIKKAVQRNQFDKMKKQEASGALARRFPKRFANDGIKSDEAMKVRKGKAGGYTDTLSKKDIVYCDKVLKEYGYDPSQLNHIKTLK